MIRDWIRAELRQRRHHPEFRIAPSDPGLFTRLLAAARDPADPGPLALAATNLWRAQRRLAQPGGDPAQARQSGRYLQRCRDALVDAGLVVRDHDGEQFHSGRSLEVLVFSDDPALTTETVIETVRPSIFLHDQRIQMGQVIVGCPAQPDATPGGSHA